MMDIDIEIAIAITIDGNLNSIFKMDIIRLYICAASVLKFNIPINIF